MLDNEQAVIEKKFPHKSLDLDTIDLENEEELSKQQIIIKNSKRLVLSEKAVEVFEVMQRYDLPMENIIEILMKVLDISQDSAKALFFRYREGCL